VSAGPSSGKVPYARGMFCCELAAPSGWRTAFFDCSKSASRSIVLALERFDVLRCAMLAASCAARSVWPFNQKLYRPGARFWITSRFPTFHEWARKSVPSAECNGALAAISRVDSIFHPASIALGKSFMSARLRRSGLHYNGERQDRVSPPQRKEADVSPLDSLGAWLTGIPKRRCDSVSRSMVTSARLRM
jgi:hypothetical protein